MLMDFGTEKKMARRMVKQKDWRSVKHLDWLKVKPMDSLKHSDFVMDLMRAKMMG